MCQYHLFHGYTPLPFPAMPQVDGCSGQRNGLPFRLSTPRFSRRENMSVCGRRLAGFGEAGWLIGKAHEMEREEGE